MGAVREGGALQDHPIFILVNSSSASSNLLALAYQSAFCISIFAMATHVPTRTTTSRTYMKLNLFGLLLVVHLLLKSVVRCLNGGDPRHSRGDHIQQEQRHDQ